MEFALPTALANQIVNYDPVLKKEAARTRAARTSSTRKKSEFPLGKINSLIPHHIVPEITQQMAVANINKSAVEDRYQTFRKYVEVSEGVTERKLVAILYHYESAWYAAWLPTAEEKSKYLYGFAIAFRNLSKASQKAIDLGLTHDSMSVVNLEFEEHNKKEYRVYQHCVTVQNIADEKCTHHAWAAEKISSYHKKSKKIWNECTSKFTEELTGSIPRWSDSYEMWERINPKKNNYGSILNSNYHGTYRFKDDFFPSVDNFLNIFMPYESANTLQVAPGVREKLNTPFFRKWIQSQCDIIINRFNDLATETKREVAAPFRRILRIIEWMKFILAAWPDTPVDYFQTYLDQLLAMPPALTSYLNFNPENPTISWLNKHMKVNSLFKIIDNSYKDFLVQIEETISKKGGEEWRIPTEKKFTNVALDVLSPGDYSNTLKDTMSMLERVVNHTKKNDLPELEPPKRWRITEFHDHVQAESWKISNENVPMPQDLFPAPIKVWHQEKTWTFFQPINTHQLASWGQTVRNCVGSASSYADGVKKKQHFIVLGMLDNVPRFTIQLKVNNGVMHVVQITDLSNARLSSDQQADYSEAFKKALDVRAKEVVSE